MTLTALGLILIMALLALVIENGGQALFGLGSSIDVLYIGGWWFSIMILGFPVLFFYTRKVSMIVNL
jgi:hypothetical protein